MRTFLRGVVRPSGAGLFVLKVKVQLFLCVSLLAASCGGGVVNQEDTVTF